MRQVIAAECDAAILFGRLAQENAEHSLKGVLGAELIDLVELLHETLQVLLGAGRSEANDASEPIAFDARGLVRLQNLHVLDAWCLITLFEADWSFIQETIDIARSISIFDSTHKSFS